MIRALGRARLPPSPFGRARLPPSLVANRLARRLALPELCQPIEPAVVAWLRSSGVPQRRCFREATRATVRNGSLAPGAAFEPIEVFVEAGTEFFGQRGPGVAGDLADPAIFAHLLLVEPAAEERQGRIESLAVAAATGRRTAAATPLGVDALRLQQELDRLGLGGDGRIAGFRPKQNLRRLAHDFRDLGQ